MKLRSPTAVVRLAGNVDILWEEKRIVHGDVFDCHKCHKMARGFKVPALGGRGGRNKTVFCHECLSIVAKPGRWGHGLADIYLPVNVTYEDGSCGVLAEKYSPIGKTPDRVEHCTEMVCYHKQMLKGGPNMVFEGAYECPVCQVERLIRTIVA